MKFNGNRKTEHFAVILAGGEGSRLKNLTKAIAGDERPKQFCPILHDETLLDVTRKRSALKIAPENTFYSLTRHHEKFYKPLLADVLPTNLIVQPENKGTAPAILYSLLRLAEIAPQAEVAFFPSDHYLSNDKAFMKNVETAFDAVETKPDSIVLLGIEPEHAETSYGWIESRETLAGDLSKTVNRVKRFWEKPSSASADYLLAKGCLWNSFVMVGKVRTFLNLIKKNLPDLYRIFAALSPAFGTPAEIRMMQTLYDRITETNFSSEVLEKAIDELYVLRVSDVIWSDLGEPERVLGTLKNLGIQKDWMAAAI